MTQEGKMNDIIDNQLDSLIHEAARLKIMAALYECEFADFTFILGITGLTRGNLSVHARKLADAGYMEETKAFVARHPKTTYRLTETGRKAFENYRKALKKIAGI